MATVLERIRAAGAERERGALGEYWKLVREVAIGKADIDPGAALEACAAAGRSAEDFHKDASTLARRMTASAGLADAAEKDRRAKELQAEMDRDNAELTKVIAEAQERIGAKYTLQLQLEAEAMVIRSEHRRAFEVCPYPELDTAHADGCAKRLALSNDAERMAERIWRAKRIVAEDRKRREGHEGGIQEAASLAKELPGWEKQLRELHKEIAEVDAELRRIEGERLKP